MLICNKIKSGNMFTCNFLSHLRNNRKFMTKDCMWICCPKLWWSRQNEQPRNKNSIFIVIHCEVNLLYALTFYQMFVIFLKAYHIVMFFCSYSFQVHINGPSVKTIKSIYFFNSDKRQPTPTFKIFIFGFIFLEFNSNKTSMVQILTNPKYW